MEKAEFIPRAFPLESLSNKKYQHMTITSVFGFIHGVESKMNHEWLDCYFHEEFKMYSEECQIHTLSSKNVKISEKTSSNDVKSERRV